MRLRRAVLQTPTKSSVLPRLPLHNNGSLLTHAESTLPQLLTPLHFNSSRCNTYKKPGGGAPRRTPNIYNSLPPLRHRSGHAGTPATPIPSSTCAHFASSPPGYPPLCPFSNTCQPAQGSRVTERGTRVTAPLVPRYRCGATRKVPESQMLLLCSTPGNISAPPGV
jgi:hypothetical protein